MNRISKISVVALLSFTLPSLGFCQSGFSDLWMNTGFRLSGSLNGYFHTMPGVQYNMEYGMAVSGESMLFTGLGMGLHASVMPVVNDMIQYEVFAGAGAAWLVFQNEFHFQYGHRLFLGYKKVFAGIEFSNLPLRQSFYYERGETEYTDVRAQSSYSDHSKRGAYLRLIPGEVLQFDLSVHQEMYEIGKKNEDFWVFGLGIQNPEKWKCWLEFSPFAPLRARSYGSSVKQENEIPLYLQIGFGKIFSWSGKYVPRQTFVYK